MSVDRVKDHERLFRSVKLKPEFIGQDGRAKISAFNDRNKRPSVDRAQLIDDEPTKTNLFLPGDYVLQLVASEIRAIPAIEEKNDKGRNVLDSGVHKVDVEPVTEGHHAAHAEIFLTRLPNDGNSTNSGAFQKLKVRLAEIAIVLKP